MGADRTLRNRLSRIKGRIRREGRRFASVLLCASLVAGNLSVMSITSSANSSDADYTYEMKHDALQEALIEAVSEGTTINEELEFYGEFAEDYAQLMEADGALYELDPEYEKDSDRDNALDLRVFARVSGSIELDEDYEIDGSEEIIFLVSNKTNAAVSADIVVGNLETGTISVLPGDSFDVEAEKERSIWSSLADSVISVLTGSAGGSGGSSSTGGADNAVKETVEETESIDENALDEEYDIVITENDDETVSGEIAEDSEVSIEDDSGSTDEADSAETGNGQDVSGSEEAGKDNDQSDAVTGNDHDTEDARDTTDAGASEETEAGQEDAEKGEDSESGEDTSEDSGTGSENNGETDGHSESDPGEDDTDAGHTEAGDDREAGDSPFDRGSDTSSGNGSGSKEDTSDSDGDTAGDGAGSGDIDDAEDSEGSIEISSISVHRVGILTVGNATSSEAEEETEKEKTSATPSDATSSDAERLLDGVLYESVWFDGNGAAAFITTAADLRLDADVDGNRMISCEGDGYRVEVSYGEDAGLPRGVEVSAVEYASDTDEFRDYYAQTAELYEWEEDRTDSVRLFDITLLSDGTEVEPAEAVRVALTYLDGEALGDCTITHFAENGTETLEVMSEYVDGEQTMSFDMESFSYITVTQTTTTLASFWLYMWTSDGELVNSDTIAIYNQVLEYTENSETYYLIPRLYFDSYLADYGYTFNMNEYCPLFYLPYNYSNYFYVQYAIEHASYAYVNNTWYVRVQDDSTYTGSSTRRANVFYLPASVVLNLGNGNGTSIDKDYSGSDGVNLRYSIDLSGVSISEEGTVEINLPCDENLNKTFTIADSVTEKFEKEQAYDYRLVGWYNIATGEYYDVKNGSVIANIDLHNNNVFYANWIANSYDNYKSGTGTLIDTEDTSDFVTIHMFDYNELFNLYSSTLTQTRQDSELWTDSGSLYETPPLASTDGMTELRNSFCFRNNTTSSGGYTLLSAMAGYKDWNYWTGADGAYNDDKLVYPNIVTSLEDSLLEKLFDTSAENTKDNLGVYYVGEGNYLFSYDNDKTSDTYGYYIYDSASNAAVYEQSDERFYVYDETLKVTDATATSTTYNTYECFLPYNAYEEGLSTREGFINYWFGMNIQVDFYLPNDTGTTKGNQWNEKDMIFNFSGDDDVWVFVDDDLVLDLGGIHDAVSGSINFSTGDVIVENPNLGTQESSGTIDTIESGSHTLRFYYLERGGTASNLKLTLNLVPRWKLESATAGTMSVTKEWKDENGNAVTDTSDTSLYPAIIVGLFEKTETAVSASADSADYNGTTYSLTDGYSYDSDGNVNAYVSGGYLYVRGDTQELSSDNNWTYTWELLDEDKTYEVLELTSLPNYKVTSDYTSLQSYNYWYAVDGDDLNGTTTDSGGHKKGGILENDLQILLTDGAQNGTASTSGFPTTYSGYVIDSDNGSISEKEAQFSQMPEEDNGTYIYGVTSDTYIDTIATSVWTIELSNTYYSTAENNATVYIPEFYLKDSDENYLTITGSSGNYSLTTVDTKVDAAAFSYNSLGELRTDTGGGLKVLISDHDIAVDECESTTNTDNVKIYVKDDLATVGRDYTITNTRLSTVTLKKVDSSDETKTLDGAEFTLQNASGNYYSYNSVTDKVAWEDTENKLTTENDGSIYFNLLPDGTYTLTEVVAPDGYNRLSSPIEVVIGNGVITSATYGGSADSGVVSVDSDDTSLVITVKNTSGSVLPETGGPGALPFRAAGLLLAGSSAYLIYATLRRKRRWQRVD